METVVVDPAKVVRLASTALSLLEEMSTPAYDEPTTDRDAVRHASAAWARLVVEVGSSLSDEALEELGRLIPRLPDEHTTAGELRVIESQLVGWLGGIIAGEHLDEPDVLPVPDGSP